MAEAKRIGLVSCSKRKSRKKASARRLFQGALFKKALVYAEKNYDIILLLSERYHLIGPDEVIEPYEEDIYRMSQSERRAWADAVFSELKKFIIDNSEVYFHASKLHREKLVERLEDLGVTCYAPLANLMLGEQLQWYNRESYGI